MPELPEVETVRKQLKNLIIGKRIIGITIIYSKIIHSNLSDFKESLIGQRFTDISRYGKYLIFELEENSIVSHLRMEGKYYLRNKLNELSKHDHIVFHLDDFTFLTYHDVRKFGTMELVNKNQALSLKSIEKLGPEINDPHIDVSPIKKKIQASTRPIKSLLLDQSIVCGLGNIYVDESLFLAGIHPESPGKSLSKNDIQKIIDSAQIVVEKAIQLGGTTIRSYQSTMGVDGRFQNHLNVHTLKGKACVNCGEKIIKIKVGGRGTYLCSQCQKKEVL